MRNIGKIQSHLAGLEYTLSQVCPSDMLTLEREPGNQRDRNAIMVMRGKDRVGYLNRHDALWLAPLMDRGLLEIRVAPLCRGSHTGVPVELSFKTTRRGEGIFSPNREDSVLGAVHNSLLAVYFNLDTYSLLKSLKEIARIYSNMTSGLELLPETTLIFKLIMARILELESRPDPGIGVKLRDFFNELKIGQAVSNEGVSVVPLYGKTDYDCKYMNCGDALDNELLSVREVSESGAVSSLTATNRADRPVFIISGQGLKGAKQDRIVNISIIIDVKTAINVPVSCVEARRWNYANGNAFRKSNIATPEVRFCLNRTVNENVKTQKSYCSNQGAIWDTVDKVSEERGVKSETACLNDVYDSYAGRLEAFSDKIRYPENASGLAVFNGGKLVSVDLFGHPELMKANWDDIIRSVAIGVATPVQSSNPKLPRNAGAATEIRKFLEGVIEHASAPEKSPGKGQYVRSQSKKHEAGLLIDDGGLVHLSAYKIN